MNGRRYLPTWLTIHVTLLAVLLGKFAGPDLLVSTTHAAAPGKANSQTDASPANSVPSKLEYRRIFVPEEQLAEIVPKDDRYLSIEKDEFERLLQIVRAGERGEILNPARLSQAIYRARLEGDALTAGSAELAVEHQGMTSCILPLEPCNLAISDAVWKSTQPPAPAVLGNLAGSGPLGVIVERSDTLQLTWTLQGERNTPDSLLFDFELPQTPAKLVELNLPDNQVLLSSRGVISKVGSPNGGRQVWRLELGGQDRVNVRVVSIDAANQRRRLTLLRQSDNYDFSPRGVQVSSDWTIDVHHEPLSSIALTLEPTLRLVMARLAGEDIPWTATTNAETGVTSVILQLAEPIEGVGRVLQLKAVAPLETDAPWQLPRLRAEGMFWAEGKTRLVVPAPLSLLQLTQQECRQTTVEELSTPLSGEVIELQHFSADASVEVLVARQVGKLQVRQGASIDVTTSELTARVAADFRIDEAELFSLTAQIAGEWIIDSVESVPSGALLDWSTESISKNTRRLSVELRKAITPSSPLRLILNGRWRRPVTDTAIPVGDFRMVDFDASDTHSHFVLVRPAPTLQLQTMGDATFPRRDPELLDPAQSALFDGNWQGVLFDVDQTPAELSFQFQTERPRFAADVSVDAFVADGLLTETYRVHCSPESARVDRVLIHFSERRESEPRWTLDGESDPQVSARKLSPDETEVPDQVVGGETWEVLLKRPRLAPFDIKAVRTQRFGSEVALSLAAVPDAVAQTGEVHLSSSGSARLVLRSNRLKRVPGEQITPARSPEDRGSFVYETERDVFAPPTPALIIAPAAKDARLPAAWVWSRQLESKLAGTGSTAHLATFRLENLGRTSVKIRMPDATRVQAVWLDETPLPQSVVDGFEQQFSLELPPGRRFPTIVVYYDSRPQTPWLIGHVEALPPTIDVPVLSTNWTVWLPPGFEVASGTKSKPDQLHWSSRLFGPLGRLTATYKAAASLDEEPDLTTRFQDWVFPAQLTAETFLQALGESLPSASLNAAPKSRETSPSAIPWREALLKATAKASQLSRAQVESETSIAALPLSIDEQALRDAGITASQSISIATQVEPQQRALIALQSAGLALLVQPQGMILTSMEAAAMQSDKLDPLVGNSVFRLSAARWTTNASSSESVPSDSNLLTLAQWTRETPMPERPWQSAPPVFAQAGWTSAAVEGEPTESSPLVVVSRQRMSAVSSALFLFVCAVIWWLLPGRTTWYVSILGCFGGAALLVPAGYVPLTNALVVGSLTGGCALLLKRYWTRAFALPTATRKKTLVQEAIAVTLALCCAVSATNPGIPGLSQEPDGNRADSGSTQSATPAKAPDRVSESATATTRPEIFQVFIPVDEQLNPSTTHYLISDRLRTLLQARAYATAQLPPAWMLTSAEYQMRLNPLGTPQRLNVVEIKSTWKFRTFQRDVKVSIPLARSQFTILPASARLNSLPASPTWDETGKLLQLSVSEPREYELSLLMGPADIEMNEPVEGVDIAIPRLATSRLLLHLPTRTAEISLPSLQGALRRESNGGGSLLLAALGPADRLTVGWPRGETTSSGSAQTEVEELHWLQVQPGAVELYVRLKVKVLEGRIGQLRMATDPRLRLLPMGEDSPVAQVRSEAGPVQTLILDLKRPVSDQVTVDARMLLTGASGIGNLRLPYAQLLGSQIKQRLLAISLNDGLAPGDAAGEALATIAVGDFTSAWGETNASPQLAFRLPAQDLMWSLPIRPKEPLTRSSDRLSVGVGRKSTRVLYEAELNTETGFNFQHSIKVPATLVVDEVQVEQADGGNRLSHWSQATAGQVTVFLNQAVAGKHRIQLTGTIPTKFENAWRIPQIHVQSAQTSGGELLLYRTADVFLNVNPGPKLKLLPAATDQFYQEPWGRLFARYAYASGPADILLAVSHNTPEISPASAIITRLSRHSNTWQAELDYRLRVHQGLVDVIRFDVPSTWSGPFVAETDEDIEALLDAPERRSKETSPATSSNAAGEDAASTKPSVASIEGNSALKLQVLPGSVQGRIQLIVTPQRAIDDSFRLRIRGPLQIPAGERIRVPEFLPRGVEHLDRYVLLPTVIGPRRWSWDVRGLKVSAPPANLSKSSLSHSPAPTYEAYQVVGDRFDAISKNAGRTSSVANVRLADISALVSTDGQVAGVATFDLEPSGLTECLLELPANFQPVQMRVAGLPALAEPAGNGKWRIPLGPQQLPQRLEVLFAGNIVVTPGLRSLSLAAPILWQGREEIPIQRTLWSVYNARKWGTAIASRGESVTQLQLELTRMRSIASLLDTVENQAASEHTTKQLDFWYQSWATRMRKTHERLLREGVAESNSQSELFRAADALIATQETAASRLGVLDTLVRLQSQTLPLMEGNELWAWNLSERLPVGRFSFEGKANAIDLRYPAATKSDLPWRLAGALLLAAIFTGLVDLTRRGWLQSLFDSHLHWLGIAGGILWVACLSPAFVGWGIILLSVLAGFWNRRSSGKLVSVPSRSARTAGSLRRER